MPLMEISTARVIKEVEARPSLWDPSHPDYKSKHVRLTAWFEIFRELVPGFDDLPSVKRKEADKAIQQRWKTARDAYMRNKAMLKSGATVKKYFYYDQCSFLDKLGPGWYESKSPSVEELIVAAQPRMKRLVVQVEPLSPSNVSTYGSGSTSPTSDQNYTDPLSALTSEVQIKQEQHSSNDDVSFVNDNDYFDNGDGDSHDASQLHTEVNLQADCSKPTEIKKNKAKKKKVVKRKLVGNEISIEVYKMMKETSRQMKDDNMAFFMSLLPMVNKFSDRRKLLFRSEVIRIALELSSPRGD